MPRAPHYSIWLLKFKIHPDTTGTTGISSWGKTPLNEPNRHSRETLYYLFATTAHKNWEKMKPLLELLEWGDGTYKLPGGIRGVGGKKLGELYEATLDYRQCAYVTIVFSAMALEAYINDYGTRKLKKTFFEDHLDKLNTVSKWIIIPQLATGNPFPKDQHAYELLQALFKFRNELIHFKPRKVWFSIGNEPADPRSRFQRKPLGDMADKAIKTLESIAEVMSTLDPEEKKVSQIAPWLETKVKLFSVEIPGLTDEELKSTILEIQVNAAFDGHELNRFESADTVTGGFQAQCQNCDRTVWVSENGIVKSLLGESCPSGC